MNRVGHGGYQVSWKTKAGTVGIKGIRDIKEEVMSWWALDAFRISKVLRF